MIPLKLEIQNFLSYRDNTILDFQGIHLASITGANGSGKSSILDAITWALFGKSRSKSDDDVVNRQASYKGEGAEVIYVFELDSAAYRIIRRKKARKAMFLEFQVATPDDNWKSLSESSLRQTQAVIESLLKMNFETFINSSFLLQGKADEFTIRTPNKRKEILAELLGVNEWDRYKEIANSHRRDEENALLLVESRLEDIDRELAERPEREATLKRALETSKYINDQLDIQEKLLSEATRTDAALKQQKQIVENLAANLEQQRHQLEDITKSQERRQQEKNSFQKLFAREEEIKQAYATWQEAKKVEEGWQQLANKHNDLLQEMKPYELILERERSRLNQRCSELQAQEQRVVKMRSEREELLSSIQLNKDQLSGLDNKLAEFAKVQQQWHGENDLLNQLETERKLLAQESSQLKLQAAEVSSLEIERKTIATNMSAAADAVDRARETLTKLSEDFQRSAVAQADLDVLISDQQRLKANMNKLRDRLDRLREETGGKCPLCGQNLTEDHRKSMLAELEADGKGDAEQYRNNQSTIKELTAELTDLKERVTQKDRLERELKAQQQRFAAAEAKVKEIDRQIDRWQQQGADRLAQLEEKLADQQTLNEQRKIVKDLQVVLEQKEKTEKERQIFQREVLASEARLKEITRIVKEWEGDGETKGLAAEFTVVNNKLANKDFDPAAQASLDELRQKVDEINYSSDEHELAAQRKDDLASAEIEYQDLKQAQAAVKPLEDSLADLAIQIGNLRDFIAEQEAQYHDASHKLQELDAGESNLVAIEKETFRLREENIAASRSVATAQQNVSVLDALNEQRLDLVAKQEVSRQRIRRLKMLEKACGRDGVQALLIEKALPEIEENANELLARLSNGELTVDFDTVRQLKSSDRTVETLDIRIIDNIGERPYENYSGGEQFRVNFAIRLAISRILTKRAGARLQTLVIDEGFGSQDPDGRQRLIEAINTIQGDFKKILIITHIDEMRDAFPNRIEVVKGPAGSRITIV